MAPETDKGGTKGAETNKGETNGLLLSQVWFPWSLLGLLFGTIGVPIGSPSAVFGIDVGSLWIPLLHCSILLARLGQSGGQLKVQSRQNQNRNPFRVVKESKLKPFLSYKLKGFGFGLLLPLPSSGRILRKNEDFLAAGLKGATRGPTWEPKGPRGKPKGAQGP